MAVATTWNIRSWWTNWTYASVSFLDKYLCNYWLSFHNNSSYRVQTLIAPQVKLIGKNIK